MQHEEPRTRVHRRVPAIPFGLAAALWAGGASALTLGELGFSSAEIEDVEAQLSAPVVSPGIAFGSPVGFGLDYWEAIAGVGGQTVPSNPGADAYDGAASVGVGIGDANEWIAAEVVVTAISVNEGFAEDGNINAKLHHVFPWGIGVAVGVEAMGPWGDAVATDESYYVTATKAFDIAPRSATYPLPVTITVGAGDERFADPGDNAVNAFGAISFTFFRRVSIIADYTGRDFNAGISLVPVRRWPIIITGGMINLQEEFGSEVEFAGGIGYSFRF